MDLSGMVIENDELTPSKYHKGYSKRVSTIAPDKRPFVAWDGEGINLFGPRRPQSYVLFGSSVGKVSSPRGLSTFDILDYILAVGEEYPHAFHVGFAFGYDSNMILKGLHPKTLEVVHKYGGARIKKRDGTTYRITFTPGKFFRVTRYGDSYSRESNSTDKVTVTIDDIFSFFGTSFIKAYSSIVGEVPDIIVQGKANRKTFSMEDYNDGTIDKYWSLEIQMLRELAESLRQRLYDAGLRITRWYGPGTLATFAMKRENIKSHMSVAPDKVREAARYAYAGGRFELFKVGRFENVYSIDINSAYPSAITQLPSLSDGEWVHESYDRNPTMLARFGVYRIRFRIAAGFKKSPGPIFHRDHKGNISYPWMNEGWYWTPEVEQLIRFPGVEVIEGWHYLGSQTLPFDYVNDMFATRRLWKQQGNPSQIALKLCMNSHYGKMAQRVGWDPEKNRIPPWHQLEWAGWVTSHTRAKLYSVMKRIPWQHLIAVETDGIYTTMNPAELGIEHSEELGGWDVSQYDEVLYVQSGLAWLRKDATWSDKRRGLDADSFTRESAERYLLSLTPEQWQPFNGQTTRFIGLGAALASNAPTGTRHCVWETRDREISPGYHGKRIHIPTECDACSNGKSSYEQPHDLVIRSLAGLDGKVKSFPHDIPWEGSTEAAWRAQERVLGEADPDDD